MMKQKIIILPLFFILTLIGCKKDADCVVGNWTNGSAICSNQIRFEFNGHGTGVTKYKSCGNCSNVDPNWEEITVFSYSVEKDEITIEYMNRDDCVYGFQFLDGSNTLVVDCGDESMSYKYNANHVFRKE